MLSRTELLIVAGALAPAALLGVLAAEGGPAPAAPPVPIVVKVPVYHLPTPATSLAPRRVIRA